MKTQPHPNHEPCPSLGIIGGPLPRFAGRPYLVSLPQHFFFCFSQIRMSSLISAVAWVRRGVAAQHPEKYVLDDPELERVSALARIELEDARVELERAHLAAQSMGKGAEGDEADDNGDGDDGDEADWVESVT